MNNFDFTKWSEFLLKDLFFVTTSKDANLFNSNAGSTPYVSASSENNGVTAYVDAEPTQKPNTLTIARNGSVGSTFYQPQPYCASPDDVRILTPKFEMNIYIGLFFKTIIEREKFRYAYGRKLGTKRIQNMVIRLPSTIDSNPDFKFMENYTKKLNVKPITTMQAKTQNSSFVVNDWKEFYLNDLFCFERGRRLTKENRFAGDIPLITAGFQNQGVAEYIRTDVCKLYSNKITIDMFGNSFYRGYDFYCDDNILILIDKNNISLYAKLFIVTVINVDKYRYSYGKQYRQKDICNHIIKLPVKSDGSPDWAYMEDYIKSLPYGDRI